MKHNEPSAHTETQAQPGCEVRSAAAGTSFVRALERAALRDLKAAKRSEYRAQDAEDRAAVDALRGERNSKLDELDAQARAINTQRELALSGQRANWNEARATAIEAKRGAKSVRREARRVATPLEREYLEQLRHEHNAEIAEIDAEVYDLNVARGLAIAELRQSWLEAKDRKTKAKRAFKLAMREVRKEQAARHKEEVELDNAERHARNEASDARWTAIRKMVGEREYVLTQIREAKQAKVRDAALIERLRAQEREMHATIEHLKAQAREADLAAEKATFERHQAAGAARALVESELRNEWLEAHYEEAKERHRARIAVREFKRASRLDDQQMQARLRERRNQANEAYRQAVQAVYTQRGLKDAEIYDESLNARAEQHDIWVAAKATNKAFKAEGRASEQEALTHIRLKKNEARETFTQLVLEMRTRREISRAEDREEARVVAREVLRNYREELARRQGAVNADQAVDANEQQVNAA